MIKCNLNILLAERGLRISKVSNDTKITRPTLTALANNNGKGIQYETLNKLCHYLNVSHCELFTYTPYDVEYRIEEGVNFQHESNLTHGEFTLYIGLLDKRGGLVDSIELLAETTYESNWVYETKEDVRTVTYNLVTENIFDELNKVFKYFDDYWIRAIRDEIEEYISDYFDNQEIMVDHDELHELFDDYIMIM